MNKQDIIKLIEDRIFKSKDLAKSNGFWIGAALVPSSMEGKQDSVFINIKYYEEENEIKVVEHITNYILVLSTSSDIHCRIITKKNGKKAFVANLDYIEDILGEHQPDIPSEDDDIPDFEGFK